MLFIPGTVPMRNLPCPQGNASFSWYLLWFLIVIAKQQGINSNLYSACYLAFMPVAFLATL